MAENEKETIEAVTDEKDEKIEAADKKAKKSKKDKKSDKKKNSSGFFRSVWAERKKITWYSGMPCIRSSGIILVVMVVIAAVIGVVDWIFGQGVDLLGQIPELF